MYRIEFTPQAVKGILRLRKSEPQAYRKMEKLLLELQEHPTTGTGQVEALKGNKSGLWSRRISGKHRLIYLVNDVEVKVLLISVMGHYDDK
ncbi:Txe/YoeB family addiction module toxin [Parabacteroides sp. OttesenSCG-928-K15]|nr:Txe/YoeB family addiction module toxin [Parabacteroides sp. OttesenSCG-928-K15]